MEESPDEDCQISPLIVSVIVKLFITKLADEVISDFLTVHFDCTVTDKRKEHKLVSHVFVTWNSIISILILSTFNSNVKYFLSITYLANLTEKTQLVCNAYLVVKFVILK